jgi:hypothetical protein
MNTNNGNGPNLPKRNVRKIRELTNQLAQLSASGPKTTGKSTKRNQRRRERRRERQNGAVSDLPFGRPDTTVRWGPTEMVRSVSTDTGRRRLAQSGLLQPRVQRGGKLPITDQGVAFLKCAFAPPDFQASSIAGVPDDYRGPSLTRKHRTVFNQTYAAGSDYYLILAPTPGIAAWTLTTAAGVLPDATSLWSPLYFSDYTSMFGTGATQTADIVTKFRYVSNHIELVPTTNQMSWAGSISAWKLPLSVAIRQGSATTDLWSIEGLSGARSSMGNQYTGPFINGIYSACYNSSSTFDFSVMLENVINLPNVIGTADHGAFVTSTSSSPGIPGFDNHFESLVIKISGVTSTETAIMKAWACVEYQANPQSALYEFQNFSPCDRNALELYREIIMELPVGVPFDQNDSFWNRILRIIYSITAAGAFVPGPIGLLSRGGNMISQGLLSLNSG